MTSADIELLERAIGLARRARDDGNHPFGALLASSRGEVLLTAANTVTTGRDVTGHAELNLVRLASPEFDEEELASCTLYSSTEPCAMCAGAIYWSGIGRVVYALSEQDLYGLTGADPENPTMRLGVRAVLEAGQRQILVEGPVDVPEAAAVHEGFWQPGTAQNR
jgi:tRNA(Arg) A34 adenosine deaminase TadA